jgi:hypothetical protein
MSTKRRFRRWASATQPGGDPIIVVLVIGNPSHGAHHRLAHGVTTGVRAIQPALGEGEQPWIGKPVDIRPRGLVAPFGALHQKRRIGCVVQVTPGLVPRSPSVTYRSDLDGPEAELGKLGDIFRRVTMPPERDETDL